MLAVSDISTWNVDLCLATLSDAPTRANSRSATPRVASLAGTKLPIWKMRGREGGEGREGEMGGGMKGGGDGGNEGRGRWGGGGG